MVDQFSERPDPGWYDDPAGTGELRYWDGSSWTGETRAPTTNPTSQPSKPARSGWLVASAMALVLIVGVGVGVGLMVAGQPADDTRDPPAATDLDPDQIERGTPELPLTLQLLSTADRPSDHRDLVQFTDVAALRAAGILPAPTPGGDGWSTALDVGETGVIPLLGPYIAPVQLRRPLPMERVVGLSYDEVAAVIGKWEDSWLVPDGGTDAVEDRLRASPVWSAAGPGSFERGGDFTVENLGGYEPDDIEERLLGAIPERAEVAAGALRLDGGELTRRAEPLGEDPSWAAVIERLAAEAAVSAILMPHQHSGTPQEGGTPLQPAAALAMAAVVDGDGVSDLLVLEHDDPDVARSNAEAARTNLALLAASGRHEGDVTVDGSSLLIRVRLTGDAAGSSDLWNTIRRLPDGPLSLIIGTEGRTEAVTDAAPPSGQAPGDAPLEGASITVGSKDFDEQLILGAISVALLEDAGAVVDDQTDRGGTDTNRASLLSGEIDHYWEYTGTAWISFYGEADPIPDRLAQYRAVRDREAAEYGLYWLEPTLFDNTYGIALSRRADQQLGGIDTISEMVELLDRDPDAVTLCVESEFEVRADGLPGLQAHYGFEMSDTNVSVLSAGAIYDAVADRSPCTFGEVFTSDGRVATLDLKVLDDDRRFFPVYNAAPVFVESVWSTYGQTLRELYTPVAAALDEQTMPRLNARVLDGERPEDVAVHWLTSNGFIG